ncbi:addiction module protein [Bacterioplanoides sp.]|uniref:addiction module protein n=1 Tax=Bacterioplanoides sp. TaxID=2066072 RepID=UPI003B599652
MGEAAESLINQALALTSKERAIIAEQLLLSLNKPNEELDQIWAKEAEARVEALNQGKLKKVSADSVLGK